MYLQIKYVILKLLSITFLLISTTYIKAQEEEWLNIIDFNKPGNAISAIGKTSNGDYLLTVHDFYNHNYAVIYSEKGELLEQTIFDSVSNSIPIVLEELEPNKYLAVTNNGDVNQIDLINNTSNKLFSLQNDDESIDFTYGKVHQNALTVVGKDSLNKVNSIHFKIDIAQKTLIEQYVSDTISTSIALDYLANGDVIECFYPATIMRKNTNNIIVWKLIRPLDDFYVEDVVVDSEDNIFLCGTEGRAKSRDNATLLALNKNGEVLWNELLNAESGVFETSYFKQLYTIDVTSNREIIVAGTNGFSTIGDKMSSVYACKYNTKGKMLWCMDYQILGGVNMANEILLDKDHIILGGIANQTYEQSSEKGFLMKLKDLPTMVEDTIVTDTTTNIINTDLLLNEINLYPNPANTYIKIEHRLLDNKNYTVQILNEKGCLATQYNNTKLIGIDHLSTGKYFIKIESDNFVFVKSWIKVE